MANKKVLILSNMYPSSQKKYAGIFVKNQFEYLSNHFNNKFSFYVLALQRTFTNTLGSISKYLGFYTKTVGNNFKEKYYIIHLHYFYPLAPVAVFFKKIFKTKIIITVHGSDLYEKMKSRPVIKFYKNVLKKCDYIICVGSQLKEDFEKIFNIKVSEVLCAGIDKRVFYPKNITKKYDFIYVGSLIDRKGFDLVLELMTRTFKKNYKWCVVGSGQYEPNITKLAATFENNCTYIKNVNQQTLNDLYNESKWFFFPSRNEPFGLVATEAIYTGTPAICSANGGLKEQILDGVNGFVLNDICNLNSMEALLDNAFNIDKNEYDKMASNCLETNNQFSLKYVCERLIKIYEDI